MYNTKNCLVMKILFLICLIQVFQLINGKNIDEIFSQNDSNETDESTQSTGEELQPKNKTRDVRDKRALGILLQGIMEALGYSVSPIQIAAIPNPPAQMNSASRMMITTMPMNSSAATPRQRETLRFTGVLNFGNNLNTSNLVNHLAQYEQLFHGNRTTPAPSASPSPSEAGSSSNENLDNDPEVPLTEPLLVKIPLPIAPNLPPPQQPSPTPEDDVYHEEEYGGQNSEEYHGTEDNAGKKGNYEEESDNYSHNEDYEKNHEEYYAPDDRNYDSASKNKVTTTLPPPSIKSYEKEYKKNKNIINYSIENKEIRDPSEVSEEVPASGSKFGHSVYVGEPDWKQKQDEHVYKLAAEQEARAEALAEENAEREKEKSREYELEEDDEEFHQAREKEIEDRYQNQRSKYESKKKPFFDDEDEEVPKKKKYKNFEPDESEENDYYEEKPRIIEKTRSIEQKEESSKIYKQEKKPATRVFENESFEIDRKSAKKPNNNGSSEEKNERRHQIRKKLPISYDREKLRKDPVLRDSYGESLEKQGHEVDERISGYFSMFKNPNTGMYDPNRIKQFDNSDLIESFEKIRQEYGSPRSKYEEYEIDDGEDDKAEHRTRNNSRRTSTDDGEDEPENNENVSVNKSGKELYSLELETPDCDNCTVEKTEVSSREESSTNKLSSSKLTPHKDLEGSVEYEPNHSKLLQEPLEYDEGIISRLTSYESPAVTKFGNKSNQKQSSSHKKTEKGLHSIIRPTAGAIPEKLTLRSLIQEVETKEIRAWPAPFDYEYDNTENKNTIVKTTRVPQTVLEKTKRNRPSLQPRPFKLTVPNHASYEEARFLPPEEAANRVRLLLKEHENNAYNAEKENYQLHPKNHQTEDKFPQKSRLIP